MKRLKIAVAAAVLAIGGSVQAVNPVTVDVIATMDSTLSLLVTSAASQDLGTFTANQQKVSAAYTIQNNGGGLTETLNLTAAVVGGWALYEAAGNPGADQVAVDALFNSGLPLVTAFNDTSDRLTAASKACDGTNFFGDVTGMNIANAASVNMYLRVTAPSSSGTGTSKTTTVTITATAP